jgi:hypothetical protein
MRQKILLVLLVLSLLVFTVGPVFAQDMPAPFCGKLSADDCDILKSSQAAQMELSSMTSTVDASTTVAGLPGLPADKLTFNWSQDTTISLDPKITQQMLQMQMAGAASIMKNMKDFADVTVQFYKSLGVDATADVTLPKEIAQLLSTQSGIKVPEKLTVQVIMKDGFAYIATAGLTFIDPKVADMGDWIGIDVASLVEMGFAQSMNTKDPAQQQAMMESMAITSMLSSDQVHSLFDEFVQVERLDDDTVDGTDVAVFQHGFDFAGFLASPGFWQLIEDNLDTINSMSETPITAEQLQQARMAITFLGPALLQGLKLQATDSIGLEDYYQYAQNVDFNWDLSGLLQFAGTTGALPAGTPTDGAISLTVDSSNADFNDAPEIKAPENAMIVPLQAMQAQ